MVQSSFEQIGGEGFVAGYHGTANYANLFHAPDFVAVLLRTVLWVVAVVAVTMLISLGLAQLYSQEFPLRRVARWALIAPWAASVLMTSIVFKWMLDPNNGAKVYVGEGVLGGTNLYGSFDTAVTFQTFQTFPDEIAATAAAN